MPSHKKLRDRALFEMAKLADGDLSVNVAEVHLEEIIADHKLRSVIVEQLIAKGWIEPPELVEANSGWHLVMTMEGIEEAEKMEQTATMRFVTRYPAVAATAFAVLQAVLIAAVLSLFGLAK